MIGMVHGYEPARYCSHKKKEKSLFMPSLADSRFTETFENGGQTQGTEIRYSNQNGEILVNRHLRNLQRRSLQMSNGLIINKLNCHVQSLKPAAVRRELQLRIVSCVWSENLKLT